MASSASAADGHQFIVNGDFSATTVDGGLDAKWKALPAQPGGQHDLTLRGFDKPYQPGVGKGNGDWFVWTDQGTTCPA